jgi:hypothetical protein
MNRACRRIQISAEHSNYPIQRLEQSCRAEFPAAITGDGSRRRAARLNKAGIVPGVDKKREGEKKERKKGKKKISPRRRHDRSKLPVIAGSLLSTLC